MIDGRELGLPGELFTAGEVVPAGRYQRVRLGRERIVVLAKRAHLGRHWWLEIPSYVASVILSLLMVRLMRAWKPTAWLAP